MAAKFLREMPLVVLQVATSDLNRCPMRFVLAQEALDGAGDHKTLQMKPSTHRYMEGRRTMFIGKISASATA
jgi:hypothetical protein